MTLSLASLALPVAASGAAGFVSTVLYIASLLLFAYVLLDLARSFMRDVPAPLVTAHDTLGKIWEPVLRPIRNALPAMGGIDFSPLIVLIALQVLQSIVVRAL